MYATSLPLVLRPVRRSARSLLVKDAQLGLFGGPAVEVAPTRQARARKRQQEKWAQQMSLFPELQPKPKEGKKKPEPKGAASPVRGRRARKGGEYVAGKKYAGGQWIPKAAFEAAAEGKAYQGKQKQPEPQQGLAVLQDEPQGGDGAGEQGGNVVPLRPKQKEPEAGEDAIATPDPEPKPEPTLKPKTESFKLPTKKKEQKSLKYLVFARHQLTEPTPLDEGEIGKNLAYYLEQTGLAERSDERLMLIPADRVAIADTQVAHDFPDLLETDAEGKSHAEEVIKEKRQKGEEAQRRADAARAKSDRDLNSPEGQKERDFLFSVVSAVNAAIADGQTVYVPTATHLFEVSAGRESGALVLSHKANELYQTIRSGKKRIKQTLTDDQVKKVVAQVAGYMQPKELTPVGTGDDDGGDRISTTPTPEPTKLTSYAEIKPALAERLSFPVRVNKGRNGTFNVLPKDAKSGGVWNQQQLLELADTLESFGASPPNMEESWEGYRQKVSAGPNAGGYIANNDGFTYLSLGFTPIKRPTPDTTNNIEEASPNRLVELASEAGLTVEPGMDPEGLRNRLRRWITDGDEAMTVTTVDGEGQQIGETESLLSPEPTPEHPQPSLDVNADFATTKQQKNRLKVNRDVEALLRDKPNGPYTKDELTLLAKYSGKGGITDDEGSLSEYYTRPDVAKHVTDLLYQHGFKGGTVLEPSCGNGVFLHQFKDNPDVLPVGVELSSTSGKAAAALNPHADVAHGIPFERFCLDNPDFSPDAVVGNVPFGTRTVEDLEAFRKVGKGWKDNGDFFVHETLSRLKPGGVMALIVPHGITTGSNHQRLREELMKQGRVLGVHRLPNSAFEHTGTKTITDVLVIQKHPDSVLNAIASGHAETIHETRDDAFIQGKYFENHPEHVLGDREETTNQFGGASFTIHGSVEDALRNAKPFTPDVDYGGLEVPDTEQASPKRGDTRYINGRLYRLDGNPLRWHLVDEAEDTPADEGADPAGYGAASIAEAEANLQDPGKRVMIHPDHLEAYTRMAGQHLHGADAAMMRDAVSALGPAGSTVEREKLAHAMLLAGHIKLVQQNGAADEMELQQTLAMLQKYRELHGNPANDKALSKLVDRFPQLLSLQGSFDPEGKISDYFANHDAVIEQAKRSHSEAGAAMAEAFRAAGGEMVDLDTIRLHLDSDLSDDDLQAALTADPSVGYMGGGYMPLDRLLVGNGFNLMDAMMMEAESLPEGSALRRKLEDQIGTIRSRLEPRALEDMTTPFWAVGSWIPVEALNEFLADRGYRAGTISRSPDGTWESDDGVWGVVEDVITTMNRGRISHGQNTKEAKEAIATLEKDFAGWLAGSDYRLQVEEAYNVAFNGDLPQTFSGEPLEIAKFDQHDGDEAAGVRKKRLHDYQTSTIRQMAEQGRGIIALGVGLGKTATSIGLALHLKETGRAKKPTFVVPKSVLANWVREIGFWSPDANVMILGQTQQFWADGSPMWEVPGHKVQTKGGMPKQDKDGNYLLTHKDSGETVTMSQKEVNKRSNLAFKDDDRATKERKMQQLKQNSYDIVLMSEPVFQDIGLNPYKEGEYLEDLAQAGSHLNPDAKATHKDLERIEAAKRRLAERSGEKTDNIYFEDLGIDCLFHDEAHHVKNLFGTQRTGDTAFLSQAQSNRALDFYNKARYIREQNNNQNTYLLTATPTTNNPLEAFNMLQHVCPEEFEQRGINNVDDFLSMFGKIESVTVPGVDLEMTDKQGLVGFKNLKDLRKLFGKYCRMQSVHDVNEQRRLEGADPLHVPEELTQDHIVEMTDAQKELYADLKLRAQELTKKGGGEGGGDDDHIFSVISDMDKAAIDLSYYNETNSGFSSSVDIPEGEKSPKIQACAEQVMSSRNANGGKQIVFCDAVQLHEGLKRQLVAAGYPENEIMIVNAGTAKRSSDRQKISQAYNDGRISLVIGNTATMGEGMNFQIGTTDIHHLTTPWTPAAIEQRNGRGVRQGNELDGVGCHYYHAKGSFDGYRKGVVERKRGWIDDLWKGDSDEADNVNTGGLSMDEINIMMSDDPEAARAAMEANKELQMQRHREKMTTAAMKQFGQVQTMKLALSKMKPEARNSARGKALEGRLRAATEALGRNEYFPHKHLLDGEKPAYVGTDGTVLQVGDHIQKGDGSIYRITGIDNSKNKLTGQMVSGTEYNPGTIKPDAADFDFKYIGNTRSSSGVNPTSFDDNVHTERLIGSLRSWDAVAALSPDAINANRGRILDKMKEGGYSRVPFVHPETGKVEHKASISNMPEGAKVLWPHDGDSIETVLKEMASPGADAEWRYHGVLENLTGKGWRELAPEMKPRIEAYRAQHVAMAEQGPKEGDRRTNEAGHQEVLQGGRWRLVGGDEPAAATSTPAGAPDDSKIQSAIDSIPELSNPGFKNTLARTLSDDIDMGAGADMLKESAISLMNKAQTLGRMRPMSADKKEAIASDLISKLMPQVQTSVSTSAATPSAESGEPAISTPKPTAADEHPALTGMRNILAGDDRLQAVLSDPGNDEQNKRIYFDDRFRQQKGRLLKPEHSGINNRQAALESFRELSQDDDLLQSVSNQLFDEMTSKAPQSATPAAPAPTSPRLPEPETTEPHPDPIGAISDAFMALYDQDDDGASERNGVGFNGMHTPYRYSAGFRSVNNEFVANMIERLQDGQSLTPNQLKASLNLLTTYKTQLGKNGVRLPSTEELEQQIGQMPAPAVAASLKQTRHAKKGIDLHVVALDERVDRDVYDRLNSQAKRLGGYYSRYDKRGAIPGFQFEDRESAEKMMDYVYTLHKSAGPTYTIMGVPYVLRAAKLVKAALQTPIKARLIHAI
jgi:hypothetical protein